MCRYANYDICKILDLSQIKKNNNNPFFGYFSISSEILIRFELTLFTIFIIFTDNRGARCAGGLKKRAI